MSGWTAKKSSPPVDVSTSVGLYGEGEVRSVSEVSEDHVQVVVGLIAQARYLSGQKIHGCEDVGS